MNYFLKNFFYHSKIKKMSSISIIYANGDKYDALMESLNQKRKVMTYINGDVYNAIES